MDMLELKRDAAEVLTAQLMSGDRRTISALTTHLSGDPDLIRAGMERSALVELAVPVILPYMTGEKVITPPSGAVLQKAMELAAGDPVPTKYAKLALKEMYFESGDRVPLNPPDDFSVIVVGGGVTGIAIGVLLTTLGMQDRVTIFEKAVNTGGAWRHNSYPGCGVDTPSLVYSFSFYRDYPWPDHFCKAPVLVDYLETVVRETGIDQRMRFNTEVTAMTWDEEVRKWHVDVRTSDGKTERHSANFVVGATGLLHTPKFPDIPGREEFAGEWCHSAKWDHTIDVTGKRVAVIGAGSSSNQIVPSIGPLVEHLTVFQRSPHWMIPHPQYGKAIDGHERVLVREIPGYAAWYRFRQFWTLGDRSFSLMKIDPEWPERKLSANAASDAFRQQLIEYINISLEGRPDLIEKSIPDFPPFAKRMVLDNGWYETIKRDNVDLVTDPIVRITPTGLVTASGTVIDVDVIVYATGFQPDKLLSPMQVIGDEGVDIREELGRTAESYLGMALKDAPNFIACPGPNAYPAHGGSGIFNAESHADYIAACLRYMFDNHVTRMEVKPEAVREFVDDIVADLENYIWSLPHVSNWMKAGHDRVIATLPRMIFDFWEMCNHLDSDAYTWN